ncbi:GLPGLI family protein [Empedobacter tilapiae]
MKKYFLILLINFYCTLIFGQKNNFLVEYKYNYTNDSLNKSNNKSEDVVMRIYEKGFVFLPKNDFKNDTIKGDINDIIVNGKINMKDVYAKYGKTDNNLRLFYFKDKNNYLIQTNVALTKVDFEDVVPNISWKLIKEEKELNGYKVKKATTNLFGREWEAWYTEEIPFSYGPYKFNGLPGLILDIKDSEDYFHFEFMSFENSKSSIPKILDGGRLKMTRSQLENYIKTYKENPLIVLGEKNSVVRDDETFFKRKKSLLELNNNSIERGVQFNLK